MKRKLMIGSLIVLGIGLTLNTAASEIDCFPLCIEPAKVELKVGPAADVKLDMVGFAAPHGDAVDTVTSKSCVADGLVQKAEELNNTVKPIREIIGYVRSPQGLVFKLVNDHIVKIPVWIGYAIDPLGSLKHKVIDEVRTRAREAMVGGKACEIEPVIESVDDTEAIESKHSI